MGAFMSNQSKTTSRGESRNHPLQGQLADGLGPQNAARLLGVALNDHRDEVAASDETLGELLRAHLGDDMEPPR